MCSQGTQIRIDTGRRKWPERKKYIDVVLRHLFNSDVQPVGHRIIQGIIMQQKSTFQQTLDTNKVIHPFTTNYVLQEKSTVKTRHKRHESTKKQIRWNPSQV